MEAANDLLPAPELRLLADRVLKIATVQGEDVRAGQPRQAAHALPADGPDRGVSLLALKERGFAVPFACIQRASRPLPPIIVEGSNQPCALAQQDEAVSGVALRRDVLSLGHKLPSEELGEVLLLGGIQWPEGLHVVDCYDDVQRLVNQPADVAERGDQAICVRQRDVNQMRVEMRLRRVGRAVQPETHRPIRVGGVATRDEEVARGKPPRVPVGGERMKRPLQLHLAPVNNPDARFVCEVHRCAGGEIALPDQLREPPHLVVAQGAEEWNAPQTARQSLSQQVLSQRGRVFERDAEVACADFEQDRALRAVWHARHSAVCLVKQRLLAEELARLDLLLEPQFVGVSQPHQHLAANHHEQVERPVAGAKDELARAVGLEVEVRKEVGAKSGPRLDERRVLDDRPNLGLLSPRQRHFTVSPE